MKKGAVCCTVSPGKLQGGVYMQWLTMNGYIFSVLPEREELANRAMTRAGHSCENCHVGEGMAAYVGNHSFLPVWYSDNDVAEMDLFLQESVFGTGAPAKSAVALVIVEDYEDNDNGENLYVLCHNCARIRHSVIRDLRKARAKALKNTSQAMEYEQTLFG